MPAALAIPKITNNAILIISATCFTYSKNSLSYTFNNKIVILYKL
jgi:hypothetical protein